MTHIKPTLSVCVLCRAGLEELYMSSGGRRFAKELLSRNSLKNYVTLMGANCMSNCKRV